MTAGISRLSRWLLVCAVYHTRSSAHKPPPSQALWALAASAACLLSSLTFATTRPSQGFPTSKPGFSHIPARVLPTHASAKGGWVCADEPQPTCACCLLLVCADPCDCQSRQYQRADAQGACAQHPSREHHCTDAPRPQQGTRTGWCGSRVESQLGFTTRQLPCCDWGHSNMLTMHRYNCCESCWVHGSAEEVSVQDAGQAEPYFVAWQRQQILKSS